MGDKKAITSAVLPAATSETSPEQSDKAIKKLLRVLNLGYSVSEYRTMQAEQEKKRELTLRDIADIGGSKKKSTRNTNTKPKNTTPITVQHECSCGNDWCPCCREIFDRRGIRRTTPMLSRKYSKEGVLWATEILNDPLTISHLPSDQQVLLRTKARDILGISPRHQNKLINIEKKFYIIVHLAWDKSVTRWIEFSIFVHGDPSDRIRVYEEVEDLGSIVRCKEHWADKLDDWRFV